LSLEKKKIKLGKKVAFESKGKSETGKVGREVPSTKPVRVSVALKRKSNDPPSQDSIFVGELDDQLVSGKKKIKSAKTTTFEPKGVNETENVGSEIANAEPVRMSTALKQKSNDRSQPLSSFDPESIREMERRQIERENRSIFIKYEKKSNITDFALRSLHSDIVNVVQTNRSAFLQFATVAARDKAFPIVSKSRVKGKPVQANLCGEQKTSKAQTKYDMVDPFQLVLLDLPAGIVKDKLEVIFPNATNIFVFWKSNNGFVLFDSEEEAKEAFEKHRSLKIGGVPITVRYRTFAKSG